MIRTRVLGTGSYAPAHVLSNKDLEKMVETSDEWISTRTGIKNRHISKGESAGDLAINASKIALEKANIQPEEVDIIIVATVTPDTLFPATACWVQKSLGIEKCLSFDISAACSGFLYGLSLADNFLKLGEHKTALVIGSEVLSLVVDWEDRNTCVLFGDGSGAAVLQGYNGNKGSNILSRSIGTDVAGIDLLKIPGGGSRIPYSQEVLDKKLHTIQMKGNEVFKNATRTMVMAIESALEKANLTVEDINWFIPHQANIRIINYVGKRLKIPKDKVIINLQEYGNTSAASIPIALDESLRNSTIKSGDLVCLFAFGAGFTYGAIIMEI